MGSFDIFNNLFDLPSKVSTLLFDDREKDLASLVYSIAYRKVNEEDESDVDCDEVDLDEKMENLENLKDLFEKADASYSEFLDHFPKWSSSRKASIEQLHAIANSLQLDRFKGNISKLVGGCVGAMGGTAVVGSILFPPLLLPLSIGGGIASVIGGATVFGTSVTEIVLLKKRMTKAKTILEEDQQDFTHVMNWFERTNELKDAIDEIIGFDLMETISKGMTSLLDEIRNVTDVINSKYYACFKLLAEPLIHKMCMEGNILVSVGLQLAPAVVSFIFVTLLMNTRNRQVFDSVVLTHRLTIGMLSGVDAGLEVGRVVALMRLMALKSGSAVAESVPRALTKSVALRIFVGVGIALDVVNIVLTSIDVQKGSLSKQSEDVKKAAEELQSEYDYVHQVHLELETGTDLVKFHSS